MIAHALAADGQAVVATDRAVYLPSGDDFRRVGWEAVARASWEGGVLVVSEAGGPGETPPRHSVTLDEPGQLPDAVHDRVTSTIVVSRHVRLRGAAGVLVIGRRRPGSHVSGDLAWSMAFDSGLDSSDPQVRAEADAALHELRTQLGL